MTLILGLLVVSLAGGALDQRGSRPENTAPGVAITKPAGGSTLNGIATIWMNAWDADNVSDIKDVWVRIDGGDLINATYNHTDGEGQWWYYDWNTTKETNGWHSIKAVTFDGIDDSSDLKEYKIENAGGNTAPLIGFVQPKDGESVNGIYTIWMIAWDADNVSDIQKVWLKIDEGPKLNATYNHTNGEGQWWYYVWNTTQETEAWHLLTAITFDGTDDASKSIEILVDNIQENKAPLVDITKPTNGAKVSGTVTIWVKAWDPDGNDELDAVYVRIDEGSWVKMTKDPEGDDFTWWYFNWDTTKVEDGEHHISAYAWDGTDDSEKDTIFVIVDNVPDNNAPGIVIVKPTGGSSVSGTVTIWMNAWDADNNSDIKNVWVKIDEGPNLNATYNHTDGEGQWWYYIWNTTGLEEGWHVIKAIAFDGTDDASDLIEIKVDNVPDNNEPGIVIITPKDGATVNGIVTIWMNAWDADNISDIQNVWVRINGGDLLNATYNHTDGEGQWWYYIWNTTGLEDGWHKIKAITFDGTDDASDLHEVKVNNNQNNKPFVNITYPPDNNGKVNGTVKITGYAWDDDEGDKVELVQVAFDSGEGPWYNATDTSGNNTWWTWEYDWNTTLYDNGEHAIVARSWDGELYSDLVDAHVIVNNTNEPGGDDDDDDDGGGSTPGFETIALIAAVGLGAVMASFRRRHRRWQI